MAYDNYFQQYGNMYEGVTPAELSEIARLESSYNPNAMNDWDSNAAAGTPSGGLMQFIHPTFSGFLKTAQADNPQTYGQWTADDWMDPEAQVAVAAHAIGKGGKGSHWTTYDRARGGGQSTGSEAIQYGQSAAPVGGDMGDAHDPKPGLSPQEALLSQVFAEDPEQGQAIASAQRARQRAYRGSGGGSYASYDGPIDYKDFPRKEGEPVWQWLQRIGQAKFGLQNDPGTSQTFGGQHSSGSPHYSGQAIDFGDARNSYDKLNQAAQYYGQIPGANVIWQAPGHYNHLHVGFQ